MHCDTLECALLDSNVFCAEWGRTRIVKEPKRAHRVFDPFARFLPSMKTSSPSSVPVVNIRFHAGDLKVEGNPVVFNRIRAVMAHTTRYAFKAEARLAHDAKVSKSALNRLINGLTSPSYFVVVAITRALEERLGRRIDPRDLVSVDGRYLTPSLRDVCGCRGCPVCQESDEQRSLKQLS